MENIVWKLFQETGDIKYYLLAKKLKESEDSEDSRCQRNLPKRDQL